MARDVKLRVRAREALGDAGLQASLGQATDRFALGRTLAMTTIGNWEELRDAARAQRAAILSRLPDTLARLADRVTERGGHVFWAANAEEANAYVAGVARRSGAKLAVKSKSMVSEEIHLNDALGAEGVEVVETDLGEWIVQLAGEMPSHIIAPALHKTSADVAELFKRIGGGDLTAAPPELCAFARERLREKFLQADLGISGVNFGVAETGSIVLVTNEGNGRMVTSLPRTHVAIMGMERVVETWEQLDLFLALLTRAATGQPISVYVTAVTGPRRRPERDGPDEFHLVILDNGRSDILGTEFHEILHCIRCGACLNVCPVYRQIGGHAYASVYSGPIGAVLTPLLQHSSHEAGELSGASSLCSACFEACPVKIPIQDLLLALRREQAPTRPSSEQVAWRMWAAAWKRPGSYRASTRMAATAARMLPSSFGPRAWTKGRARPRPPKGPSFRERFERGEI